MEHSILNSSSSLSHFPFFSPTLFLLAIVTASSSSPVWGLPHPTMLLSAVAQLVLDYSAYIIAFLCISHCLLCHPSHSWSACAHLSLLDLPKWPAATHCAAAFFNQSYFYPQRRGKGPDSVILVTSKTVTNSLRQVSQNVLESYDHFKRVIAHIWSDYYYFLI